MCHTVAEGEIQEKTGFMGSFGKLLELKQWFLFAVFIVVCSAGHCHLDKSDTLENRHICTHIFPGGSCLFLSLLVALTVLFS